MSRKFTDITGSTVTVETVAREPIRSYTITLLGDFSAAGRADYLQPDAFERARIFFHTEVDSEFSGRGLATLLVRAALAEANDDRAVVVPVCPFFAAHLRDHGDDFLANGGQFRAPRPADFALVDLAVRGLRAPSPQIHDQ